ncbi:hypothetical protein [Sphingomonas sp. Leaf25]|uniref:hypothetical protein n=1 Tax=Sphingomonas sp. Leaf25 TaxID=1735692 RepID=UPI0006FE5086|nr:hypothetical protein [Sphingomonas sp. Leaf25]KQM99374.1 hypothetical protein ASE78_17830 [Sphingomonas sp. Leaf25]
MMFDPHPPVDDAALVASIDNLLAEADTARQRAADQITTLNARQAALEHHPHYPGYIVGGMLHERGFNAGHLLAVLGVHALDWRDMLARLADASVDDDAADLMLPLRVVCETDPMLEVIGERLADERDLLKHGRIDPFWLKRPKFGLGQAAMVFGLEPRHADGYRGLYALPLAVLRRGLEDVAVNQRDQQFGAMLVPVIEAGGERLARIGQAAFHRDAEARYLADCARFDAHQRRHCDRRWRWKPPLSRQGHLAVTTAQAKAVDLPEARTRGHAAAWLGDHDANLRFAKEES